MFTFLELPDAKNLTKARKTFFLWLTFGWKLTQTLNFWGTKSREEAYWFTWRLFVSPKPWNFHQFWVRNKKWAGENEKWRTWWTICYNFPAGLKSKWSPNLAIIWKNFPLNNSPNIAIEVFLVGLKTKLIIPVKKKPKSRHYLGQFPSVSKSIPSKLSSSLEIEFDVFSPD